MKPKYKPSSISKDGIAKAKLWYENLDYIDKMSVGKKIARVQAHVKAHSKTQFSSSMGVELIYKTIKHLEKGA